MSDTLVFWDGQDSSGRMKYLILIGATLSAALYEIVDFNTTQTMFFFLHIHTNLTLNILIKKLLKTIHQPLKKTVQHFILILFRLV